MHLLTQQVMTRNLPITLLIAAAAIVASASLAGPASAQDVLGLAPQRGTYKVQPRSFNPFDTSTSRLTLRTAFARLTAPQRSSTATASATSAATAPSTLAAGAGGEEDLILAAGASVRPDYRPPVRSPYRPPPR
jgi:hypothetical protein